MMTLPPELKRQFEEELEQHELAPVSNMQSFWDDRYSADSFAYGTEPNAFLISAVSYIPRGRILCLAEGEGRNAVYLASQGYAVTAVDQSAVGLEKAQRLASQNQVAVETTVADLATFDIQTEAWDGIVSISAHLPSAIRKRVHHQVVQGLKSGGVLILEAYTERQLQMPGIGGPPPEQKDLFMSLSELRQELIGLSFVLGQETDREVNEGQLHQGLSAVVQVIAIK